MNSKLVARHARRGWNTTPEKAVGARAELGYTGRPRSRDRSPRRMTMRLFPRAGARSALSLVIMGTVIIAMGAITAATAQTPGSTMTTASGLKITDTAVGTGA